MNNAYLNKLLFSLLGDNNLVEVWWTTANRAFDYHCPKDVSEFEVLEYLEGHCFGQ